jgi:Fe-S-cluster containining protein
MMTLCLAYKDYQTLLQKHEPEYVARCLFENVDKKLNEFIEDYRKKELISCKSGCFHCCHYQVEITFEEALILANYVLEKKIIIDDEMLRTQSSIPDSEWYDYPEELRKCVFVGENGECKVYEDRPMACRKHNVTSGAEFCQGKPGPHIDGITSPVIEAFVSGAISASRESGFLPKMLQKILLQNLKNQKN